MHKYMTTYCEKCNKFSHCNNNDLICISKYKTKEQECEELKQTLTEIKNIAEEDFNHTCWETYARQLKQILQKISEYKGEYNEKIR